MAQTLFYLNAAVWLVLGVVSLLRLSDGSSSQTTMLLVVAILMFGNSGAMLVAGLGIGTGRKLAHYFAAAVLVVNIVLTFTDQVGFLDVATLAIDLILLGLLVRLWSVHGRQNGPADEVMRRSQ